jgi:Flp pilus assembly protein TadD
VPFDPAFYRGTAPSPWPPGLLDLVLAVTAVAVVGLAVAFRRRVPEAFFAVLWFAAALAPSSTLVALKEMVVDHRAYLAGAGVLFALSWWLWGEGRLVFALALVAALAARTVQYERVIGDPVSAWQDAVARAPQSVEARQGLAEAYLAVRDPRASSLLTEAASMAPRDPRVWTNLGAALLEEQKPDRAVEAFARAVALSPRDARLRDNLGVVLERLGRVEEATREYEAARAGVPALAQPRIRLAEIAIRQGDVERARALIAEASGLEFDEQETREIQALQRRLP